MFSLNPFEKNNDRSDSGIFVTCFMETFDGTNIANFTNVSILKLYSLFHVVHSILLSKQLTSTVNLIYAGRHSSTKRKEIISIDIL